MLCKGGITFDGFNPFNQRMDVTGSVLDFKRRGNNLTIRAEMGVRGSGAGWVLVILHIGKINIGIQALDFRNFQ